MFRNSQFRIERAGRIRTASVALLLAILFLILLGCSNPKVRFGYVATDQGIYAFRMDASSGAGTQVIGSPFLTKTNPLAAASPSSIVVHPSNKFLYAANQDTSTISLFKIDPTTGSLTEVLPRTSLTNSSGAVGLSPGMMTMDSGGNFLFVGNQVTNDVWVFSIGSSGALTFVSSAQLAAPPSGLTLSASGGFLYVPVQTFSAIYVFSVNSGALTQVGAPLVLNSGVGQLGIDPHFHFLYVPNPATNTVTVLLIQPDGSLAQRPGAFATASNPVAAQTDPTGAFLYVANANSANLSQFQVDSSTGVLTALTTSTAGTGTGPASFALDPTAKFLFVVNPRGHSVSEFTFDKKGTLTTTGNSLQLVAVPRSFSITH